MTHNSNKLIGNTVLAHGFEQRYQYMNSYATVSYRGSFAIRSVDAVPVRVPGQGRDRRGDSLDQHRRPALQQVPDLHAIQPMITYPVFI